MKKKLLFLLTIIICMVLTLRVKAATEYNKTSPVNYKIKFTESVNNYSENQNDFSEEIPEGTTEAGTIITIIKEEYCYGEEPGVCVKLIYEEDNGIIHFFFKNEDIEGKYEMVQEMTAPSITSSTDQFLVLGEGVKLYSKPSMLDSTSTLISYGAKFPVTKKIASAESPWRYVDTAEYKGWIFTDDSRISKCITKTDLDLVITDVPRIKTVAAVTSNGVTIPKDTVFENWIVGGAGTHVVYGGKLIKLDRYAYNYHINFNVAAGSTIFDANGDAIVTVLEQTNLDGDYIYDLMPGDLNSRYVEVTYDGKTGWAKVESDITEEVATLPTNTVSNAITFDLASNFEIEGVTNTNDEVPTSVESAVITYDVNEGEACPSSTKIVTKGSTAGELCTTTRSGYTFNGWYTSRTAGDKVTSATKINSDITIYAQWRANTIDTNAKTGVSTPALGLIVIGLAGLIAFIFIKKKEQNFN